MKDLKKKLTAAGAMLVVSAVMLSGVSYAWYTLSTNPEVKGMKTTVVANENLEIALENTVGEAAGAVDARSGYNDNTGRVQGSTSGNYYTWGNLIDLGTAFNTLYGTGDTTHPLQIRPVEYDNGTLKSPQYGEDGRVEKVVPLNAIGTANGTGAAETNIGGVYGWSESNSATNANYYAYQVNYWLKSNISGNVTLATNGVKRANDGKDANSGVNGVTGAGSYIKLELSSTTADTAAKEKEEVDEYLGKLKVRFVAGTGEDVVATIDTSGTATTENSKYYLNYGLKLKDNEKITALTKDTAQLVKMYVYLDGKEVTNADALLNTLNNVEMNIQFTNSGLDTNGDAMTGTTATN